MSVVSTATSKPIHRVLWFSCAALVAGMGAWHPSARTAPLNLADTPLFFGEVVTPNVFFMVDDSGSMDWEILTKRHFEARGYDPDFGNDENDSFDAGSWQVDGLIRGSQGNDYGSYEYIWGNSDNAYTGDCDSGRETAQSPV